MKLDMIRVHFHPIKPEKELVATLVARPPSKRSNVMNKKGRNCTMFLINHVDRTTSQSLRSKRKSYLLFTLFPFLVEYQTRPQNQFLPYRIIEEG